ncbi:MAG: ABC transporter substrate-binding protein [Anaerolineae bacterium]|nr:ABC transporter substrate-binding protein [Anaerolineae bacterium]MCO5207480.1 ABC transporter substrate-binding protein [Anaerolineae bacterium]
MKKVLFLVLAVMLAALAACSAEPEVVEVTRVVTEEQVVEVEVTTVVQEEVQVEVTREVEVMVEATIAPVDRNGGWLDTIVFTQEPNQDSAIARLAAGDIDMFADDVAGAAILSAIADAGNIQTRTQYGLYDEIFFNNGACADEAVLNPFHNQKIREAMNWAIDRDYVADELYAGLAVPKFTTISEAGADRGRFAAEIRAIEAKYAYDLEKAREIITAEMEGLGATLEDGKWVYNGEPVTLIGLIRIEDTRLQIGNYVANQLEDLGFTIERVERTSGELSPLWISSDPAECQWNWYTGAWSQTAVDRSNADNFDFFYNPRGVPWPSWQVYEPTPEFDALSLRLFNNDYADLDERAEMMAQALDMASEMATRVWVTSRTTLVPFSNDVSVTTDLAGGVSGAALWSKTARFADEVGGSMTIALPSVFTEPWNPIGGSNWVFDNMVKRGAGEPAFYSDPNTGLRIPNRAERAEVVVEEGFPMSKTLDWVDLSFAPEIAVPDDAWAGWDAVNQVFLTAADVYTEPQTAVFKSTVYYPEDMFETVKWHDGSPISVADFVMGMIINFDLGNPDSPYYDESKAPDLDQFLSAFKGIRIVSTDPLVIEHYGDNPSLDAENSIYSWWPGTGGGEAYDFADVAWHNMAIMLRGEENGGFAFTPDKAEANEIERTNMIAGPSLEVWATELAAAIEEGWIPYAATLGEYIDDPMTSYNNLSEFARRYGHYYLGTGAYFLSGVFPVEGQAIMTHNPNHPDAANRWDRFSAPAIAEVEVDGPGRVTIGDEAVFDVYVDALGETYAVDDINNVQYLLFDATGQQIEQGLAEAVEDGLWSVTLSADTTSMLAEGSNRLEVVVVSNLVAIPSLGSFEFVTAP